MGSLKLPHQHLIHRTLLTALFWLALADSGRIGGAETRPRTEGDRPGALPGASLFAKPGVPRIQLEFSTQNLERLRREPRQFVEARVTVDEVVYPAVTVHLKGATGSFRPVDDKPSLTLDFGRLNGSLRFHGLRRIHLNNSVEDPSYLNELLASELFNAAGVPAPRVTHALVEMNGRGLGLYVLKEGFTEDFLASHFRNTAGNLYEPDQGHEVDQPMKCILDQGLRREQTDRRELAEAALETNLSLRWSRLQRALDIDRFLTFAALEVLLVHRDGYCLARNNFRIYHDLDSGKMVFLPQGMDQLWGIPDLSWRPHMAGLVANSVLETPEGKDAYRARFIMLYNSVFRTEPLTNRLNPALERLRRIVGRREFETIREAAARVADHIAQRQRDLARQLSEPELQPMTFNDGVAQLDHWSPTRDLNVGKIDRTTSADKTAALHIVAGPNSAASWRTKALLGPGRYRFEGRVRIAGVKPLPYGVHQGAGLRLAGQVRQSANFTGDSAWTDLQADFLVAGPVQAVEFVCELRASAGEAWFAVDSLRVAKIP